MAQLIRARTQLLYVGGGAILYCQDGSPKTPSQNKKHNANHQLTALDPLRSVNILLREVLPAKLLVVSALGNAGPLVDAHDVRDPQHCIR
jgi:hypothetical protein